MALERFSVPAFGGGIRNDLMSQLISPGEAWDSLNEDCSIVEGASSKRRGAALVEDIGTGRIQCIYEGEIWDRKRLVAVDKVVKSWTFPHTFSAAVATFTTASDYIDVVPYRDFVLGRVFIFFNGVDYPFYWTGTGAATAMTVAGIGQNAPIGKTALWFKTYLIFGNMGSTYESLIKWCDSGDCTEWTISAATSAGSLSIETSKGGDIIAMLPLDLDTFIIYKNDGSIIACYATGSGDVIFGYKTISEGHKLVSGRAIVSWGGYHWALSQEGLLKITSSSVEPVADYGKAKRLFMGRTDNWDDAVATILEPDRKILIAYPRTGGATNDGILCYNIKYNTWDNWTGAYTVLNQITNASAITVGDLAGTLVSDYIGYTVNDPRLRYNETVIYAGDSTGKLFKFSNTTFNDDSVAIEAYRESGWIRPDPKYDGECWFRELELEVDLLGDFDLTLEYRSDYDTDWKSCIAIDTTPTLSREHKIFRRFINTTGRAIKVKWSNSVAGATYVVRSMYIVYEKMEEKDV